jgi:transcriptional regulator with XRE-family HTH domain
MNDEHKRLENVIRAVLKASREDSDVSQKELARRLQLTRNVIANIETGRRAVLMADFVTIAKALNIHPERLVRRILQW